MERMVVNTIAGGLAGWVIGGGWDLLVVRGADRRLTLDEIQASFFMPNTSALVGAAGGAILANTATGARIVRRNLLMDPRPGA